MNTSVLFSSKRDDWQTPPELIATLDKEFGFCWDAAANETNRQAGGYFGPDHQISTYRDALAIEWVKFYSLGAFWCNPPYTRRLQAKFIAKAAEEARNGVPTVMLLPALTGTKAFHAHIWDCRQHRPRPWVKEVRFLPGRLKFVGAKHAAPFPSMIVVFKA